MEKYGFGYFLKGFSYHVARQVCNKVEQWFEIPDKDGGYFGISSKSDLPNLGKFCDTIPELEVFGFRQQKEAGKVEKWYYITNVPDYIRLSTDGTLTGMWRYYHSGDMHSSPSAQRASIESTIKMERNILCGDIITENPAIYISQEGEDIFRQLGILDCCRNSI